MNEQMQRDVADFDAFLRGLQICASRGPSAKAEAWQRIKVQSHAQEPVAWQYEFGGHWHTTYTDQLAKQKGWPLRPLYLHPMFEGRERIARTCCRVLGLAESTQPPAHFWAIADAILTEFAPKPEVEP